MNKTAVIAMICGLGTSVWTWWPQTEVLTDTTPQTKQVLTASGQAVDPEPNRKYPSGHARQRGTHAVSI